MYRVDQNIPVIDNEPKKNRYPFSNMLVGDSFFVMNGVRRQGCLPYAAMVARNTRHNKNNLLPKFVAKTVSGGIRIWRIK